MADIPPKDRSPGLVALVEARESNAATFPTKQITQEIVKSLEILKRLRKDVQKLGGAQARSTALQEIREREKWLQDALLAVKTLANQPDNENEYHRLCTLYKIVSPTHIQEFKKTYQGRLTSKTLKRAGIIATTLAGLAGAFGLGRATTPEPEIAPPVQEEHIQETPVQQPFTLQVANTRAQQTIHRMMVPYTGAMHEHHGKTVLELARYVAETYNADLKDMISMITRESDGAGSSLADYTMHHPDPAGSHLRRVSLAVSSTNVKGIAQVTEGTMRRYLALVGIDYRAIGGSRARPDDYWQLVVLALMMNSHEELFSKYKDKDHLIAAYYNGGIIVTTAIKHLRDNQEEVNWENVKQVMLNVKEVRDGTSVEKVLEIIRHAEGFALTAGAIRERAAD